MSLKFDSFVKVWSRQKNELGSILFNVIFVLNEFKKYIIILFKNCKKKKKDFLPLKKSIINKKKKDRKRNNLRKSKTKKVGRVELEIWKGHDN